MPHLAAPRPDPYAVGSALFLAVVDLAGERIDPTALAAEMHASAESFRHCLDRRDSPVASIFSRRLPPDDAPNAAESLSMSEPHLLLMRHGTDARDEGIAQGTGLSTAEQGRPSGG